MPTRTYRQLFLATALAIAAATELDLSAQESGLPGELTARVDGLFAKWNGTDSPGCAVGVVQRGELVYRKGFGTSNLEYRVPNTPRTVFETASFSKSVTCACVALLMDEGKIAPRTTSVNTSPRCTRSIPRFAFKIWCV